MILSDSKSHQNIRTLIYSQHYIQNVSWPKRAGRQLVWSHEGWVWTVGVSSHWVVGL